MGTWEGKGYMKESEYVKGCVYEKKGEWRNVNINVGMWEGWRRPYKRIVGGIYEWEHEKGKGYMKMWRKEESEIWRRVWGEGYKYKYI